MRAPSRGCLTQVDEIAREAIAEAEARLARLPSQANAIEAFLEETSKMITPEQEAFLARRRSLEESSRKPIEAELVIDEEPAVPKDGN